MPPTLLKPPDGVAVQTPLMMPPRLELEICHHGETEEYKAQLASTDLPVMEDDKVELEVGEFYMHDLIGMRVFIKENEKKIGNY